MELTIESGCALVRNVPAGASTTMFLQNGVRCHTCAAGPELPQLSIPLDDFVTDVTASLPRSDGTLLVLAMDHAGSVLGQAAVKNVALPHRRGSPFPEGAEATTLRVLASALHTADERHHWILPVAELHGAGAVVASLALAYVRVVFDANTMPPTGESLATVHFRLAQNHPSTDSTTTTTTTTTALLSSGPATAQAPNPLAWGVVESCTTVGPHHCREAAAVFPIVGSSLDGLALECEVVATGNAYFIPGAVRYVLYAAVAPATPPPGLLGYCSGDSGGERSMGGPVLRRGKRLAILVVLGYMVTVLEHVVMEYLFIFIFRIYGHCFRTYGHEIFFLG